MCDVDGLGTPRDCFDVGFGAGYTGEPLERLWASLAADGVAAGDLDDWQREAIGQGWHAGRADYEAFREDMRTRADEPVRVPADDDSIPW